MSLSFRFGSDLCLTAACVLADEFDDRVVAAVVKRGGCVRADVVG
jgi:hypothetical protein